MSAQIDRGTNDMALDQADKGKGVWKSGKGRGRVRPKGRALEDEALADVQALLGDRPRRRDLLIEHLHLIQDHAGHLSAAHLRALAEEMRLSMAEIYEVATFYAHFDVVKEGETPPPALTIRVCDSLSCELAGADALRAALEDGLDPAEVRVLRAPCMGRCDTAPVLELGHNHIDEATPEKVSAAIAAGDTHAHVPDYETFETYAALGGYSTLKTLRSSGDWEAVQAQIADSGLRGLGGAGFPSGRKWGFVRANPGPRYLAVNGDEGEPGTFKDRYYLERTPHLFLEGMLIAAWAVEAETCFIYMRDEYPAVLEILRREIASLEAASPPRSVTTSIACSSCTRASTGVSPAPRTTSSAITSSAGACSTTPGTTMRLATRPICTSSPATPRATRRRSAPITPPSWRSCTAAGCRSSR